MVINHGAHCPLSTAWERVEQTISKPDEQPCNWRHHASRRAGMRQSTSDCNPSSPAGIPPCDHATTRQVVDPGETWKSTKPTRMRHAARTCVPPVILIAVQAFWKYFRTPACAHRKFGFVPPVDSKTSATGQGSRLVRRFFQNQPRVTSTPSQAIRSRVASPLRLSWSPDRGEHASRTSPGYGSPHGTGTSG